MKRIYLASPHMSEGKFEEAFVQEAFDTNWVAPLGKNVDEFETEVSRLLGGRPCVALSSGTAAMHLALKNLGIQEGDYVFCQSLTFSASANPIVYEKAIPVFIDSEKETWNMDPVALREAFKTYSPKAVIVVHLYGITAKIDEIRTICAEYQVPLIEDAAESLGTIYQNQWTGTFGQQAILSFNGNKIITTSGGGMLVTSQEEQASFSRFLATQARDQAPHYQHSHIGYNYRMSNICAGIGRGQLQVLEERIAQKRYIHQRYLEGFSDIGDISLLSERLGERSNYWLSAIQITSKNVRPSMLMEALAKENIESRPVWKPMHLQPVFEDAPYFGGEVAADLFENGLCLPSDTKMTDEDIDKVIGIIRSFWE